MTFVAYTNCETGFRHFTDLTGVDASFDMLYVKYIRAEKEKRLDEMRQAAGSLSYQAAEIAEQQARIPGAMQMALDHNKHVLDMHTTWLKRVATAEAVLNGELVRDVMFFQELEQASNYTKGAV